MNRLLIALFAAAGAATAPPPPPPPPDPAELLWSDPDTWGGTLPVDGDAPTIPAGKRIKFDLTTSPNLGLVTTEAGSSPSDHGTLVFDKTKAQTFRCSGFLNGGALDLGDSASPRLMAYPLNFIADGAASAAGKVPRTNGGFQSPTNTCRGILNMPASVFKSVGQTPAVIKTVLTDHLAANGTTAPVQHATGWPAGSRVLLSTTGLFNQHVPEVLTLVSPASGTNLTFFAGPMTARWGKLQYANKTGPLTGNMSLTDNGYRHASGNTPNVLDERATLCLLDRAINFSCPDDSDFNTLGHGFVIMNMGAQSFIEADGIRILRCGQQDTQGHYPWHWHNLSYNLSTGAFVTDAMNDQHIKRSVIEKSKNRGIVIHGTCGVTADENVLYDIRGQGIFTEDGVEERLKIRNNTVALTRRTVNGGVAGQGLKEFESFDSAGIWLTNPNSEVTGNECYGSEGAGSWFSFASRIFGDNAASTIRPNTRPTGLIDDNSVHSNESVGHRLELVVVNEQGGLSADAYNGTGVFKRFKIWKNSQGGYQNRLQLADYQQFVVADNQGQDAFGAHGNESGGLAKNWLMVGHSLNDSDTRNNEREGIASYHGGLNPKNCTIISYAPGIAAPDQFQRVTTVNGARTLWDLYTTGVQWFQAAGDGNELLSTHPGVPILSPEFDVLGPLINDANLSHRFRAATVGYGTPAGLGYFDDQSRGWVVAPTGDGGSRLSKFAFGITARYEAGIGVDGQSGLGDTWVNCTKLNNTGSAQTLGMSVTDYSGQGPLRTQMEYRAVVLTNGEVRYGISGGADTVLPTPYSFTSFGQGSQMRLARVGSTIYLQTTTDGSNWTNRYTFAATTSAVLYRYLGVAYSGSTANDRVHYPKAQVHNFRNWKIAPAIWDKNGEWDDPDTYIVQDTPFFTWNNSVHTPRVGSCPGFVSTARLQYAVSAGFTLDFNSDNLGQHVTSRYERIDPADDSVKGTWTVWDKDTSAWTPFDNTALGGGQEYIVRYPNNPPTSRVSQGGPIPFFSFFYFNNFYPALMGGGVIWHEWPASTVQVFACAGGSFNADGTPAAGDIAAGFSAKATAVGSKAALRSATTFSCYLDVSRKLVGIKYPVGMTSGLYGNGFVANRILV